jgi:hypothetical protein
LDNICESVSLVQNKNVLLKRYAICTGDLNMVYMDVDNNLKNETKHVIKKLTDWKYLFADLIR